jgi:hypothetical protein
MMMRCTLKSRKSSSKLQFWNDCFVLFCFVLLVEKMQASSHHRERHVCREKMNANPSEASAMAVDDVLLLESPGSSSALEIVDCAAQAETHSQANECDSTSCSRGVPSAKVKKRSLSPADESPKGNLRYK